MISTDNNSNRDFYNIDISSLYKVSIGKFAICEIPSQEIIEKINTSTNTIYLKSDYKELLWLRNKKIFYVQFNNIIKKVWFCKIIKYEDIGLVSNDSAFPIKEIKIIYGRCLDSMKFLDQVHRNYIIKHKFMKDQIVAIKSVAGSGKTTTLLELSKIHKDKKILYIAFNKSLVTEIKRKIS